MRILLIDVNCKKSSTGKIVYDLYTSINAGGHEAAVCYGRGGLIDEPAIYRFSPQWEVYAHAALTRITGWTGCFSPIATRNLLRYIDTFKPDVVHIHELHAYFVNIAPVINYLKTKKIKTVWTFHCEFMYTGKCGHALNCEKWKTECGPCPQVKEYPSSLIFDCTKKMHKEKKHLLETFDRLTIVTPSQWLADRVKHSFLHNKQIKVIPNGIDADMFYPRDTASLENEYGTKKAIVHVTANFEDQHKGGQHVLELARHMPDVSFYIIGNNEPIDGLPDNVYAIGRTENQERLAEWYSYADISIITSERENFPTVCLESLCCGTPVIGFDTGGTAETAPKGYGIFVPYPNIAELEKAARCVLNGELYGKEKCAEFGNANYSKMTMTQRYMKLYEKVVQ